MEENKKKFKCRDCGKFYFDEPTLKKHRNNKICVKNKEARTCKICGKTYKRKQYYKIHLTTIGHKKNLEIINIANNADNETIKKYDIVSFGSEKIEEIYGKEELETKFPTKIFFEKYIFAVFTLTNTMNLNPDTPKYHNVIITDLRSKYGQIYKNNKWIKVKIDEITRSIVENRRNDLKYLYKYLKNSEKINKKLKFKLKKLIQKLDVDMDDESLNNKENKKYINCFMENLKNLIYENREMLLKTKKIANMINKKF